MAPNKNIKGITIELGGETTGLETALKQVNKHAADLRKEIREVETALKFNPGNVELLEQQQRLLADQISTTTEKLDGLKGAYAEAEAQLSRGEIDQGEFDRLTREIIKAEDQLGNFESAMKDVEASLNLSDAEKEFQRIEAAIKDSDDAADKLKSELKEVEDALKLDPGNTELLAQEQRVLASMVDKSSERLDILKGSFTDLEAAAGRGELGADKFDKLNREIVTTEKQLEGLEQGFNEVGSLNLSGAEKEFQRVEAAIKESDDAADKLKSELKEVEDALKLDPGNTELLAQEQRVLASMVDKSSERLDILKGSFTELEAAAGRGELGADKFDRLKREIITSEKRLEGLELGFTEVGSNTGPDKAEKGIKSLREEAGRAEGAIGEIGGALAGLGVGIGGGAILDKAFDTVSLDNRIERSMGLIGEQRDAVKGLIKDVEAYGVDGGEALEGVRRQWALNSDATDEANSKIVGYAAMMTQTFEGVDFTEAIQEINEIGSELGITNEEASGLVNALLKIGFPPEQIDIIAEYGKQLTDAGFTAEEVQGIMAAGVETGTWNIDNLLDGLKEGRVRAAEMGAGLSNSFKDSIAEVTNDVNKMSDEQIEALKTSLSKQEEARSKSLDKELTNTQKHNDNLEQQKQTSLDKQLQNTEKSLDRQQQNLEKSHDKELSSAEKLADKKIALIDKEYIERLKLVDEERYNALKAVDAEIEGIENKMSADEKAAEKAANAKRKSELKARIAQAETTEERKEAQQDLAEFEADLRRKQIQDQRRGKIDSLKEEKDGINETFDARAEKIQEEQQLVTDKVRSQNDAELEGIRERQENEKTAFNERKALQLENIRERNSSELDAFKETNDAKEERLKDMHDGELERLKDINAKKLDAAMNPPDTKLYTDTIAQLEEWGDAIAAGGEKGSDAYRDMVAWLNTIEDDTLRNAIGTELFGTIWEDQGDNIVDTLMNMDEHIGTSADNIDELNEQVNSIENDPVVELKDAINDLMLEFGPLLTEIAELAGSISTWMSENSGLIKNIGLVAAALTGAVGLKFAIETVWGIIKGFSIFLGLITSPAGAIVLAIGIIVGLAAWIVLNWGPIKEFFVETWDKIKKTFSTATDNIKTTISTKFQEYKEKISEKMSEIWSTVTGKWEEIKTGTRDKLSEVGTNISDKFTEYKDTAKAKFDEVKFAILDKWEEIKTKTWDKITGIGDDIGRGFGRFKEIVGEQLQKVVDKAKEIWDKIKGIFKDDGDMEQNGKDAGNGFLKGLKSTTSDIWSAAKNLGKTTWKSIKDELKIKSPSRVMSGLGAFAGEGLAVGVESMSKRVDKASKRLATNVIPDIPDVELGGVNGKRSNGFNVQGSGDDSGGITININHPSIREDYDITLLTREIAKALNKDKRGRG